MGSRIIGLTVTQDSHKAELYVAQKQVPLKGCQEALALASPSL